MWPPRYHHRKLVGASSNRVAALACCVRNRRAALRHAARHPNSGREHFDVCLRSMVKPHDRLVPVSSADCSRFHTRPINLVVYEGSLGALRPGIPSLEAGFPLRCFQRLSVPYMATRLCPWQDNRITRGTSTQVLSYYGQLLSSILRPRQIGTKLSHDVLNPARVPL